MSEHDEHRLIRKRREKLASLRGVGWGFPNDFRPGHSARKLHDEYDDLNRDELSEKPDEERAVKVAGRVMSVREMGTGSFVTLRDGSGDIQLWIRPEEVGEKGYEEFKVWDVGDLVGAQGRLFKTKKGELTVNAEELCLLAKSLRPLPEKFHGLTDIEIRYRRRYLDLLMNKDSREVFKKRSRIVSFIRKYFDDKDFLEVETPMMQPLAGGAKAKPFITHHNALDMDLYLRIAPELYLKRLVIGGFEKVYEINRSFRNEGVSTRHNPEFTMLEFYQAYANYLGLMDLTEDLLKALCRAVCGGEVLESGGRRIDFSKPFTRISVADAVLRQNPALKRGDLDDCDKLKDFLRSQGIENSGDENADAKSSTGCAGLLMMIFEKTVEGNLHDPTFVTDYPAVVSPLARRNDKNPDIADRFELFIGGQEIANGFSELNDPDDQRKRFEEQMKARGRGDEEAMLFDEDYVTALEYGLPPTAGEGIGIDRLVMLFTGMESIRDVVLFPQMKQEAQHIKSK